MTKTTKAVRVFDTDKRIRLGIWGLGRGMSFFNTCKFLNIDVVAGCDFNAHMRDNFLKACPDAFVTDNAEEFLKQDFDAVLLATFCPAHGLDAVKCLQAGKHVLSEVTSFFSLAEGVRLVEEVEKRNLVYNLAENYPFSAANMWLASRWKAGLFGNLMYAEYEYVHECRSLCYTYIDGIPVQPGHTVHNWRSWLSAHYYCTHSLGPVMVITGTRPTMVEAFPVQPHLAGYLRGSGLNTMAPSMIQMDNGSVVRNLMGATTNDSHNQRMWGTLGSFTIGHDGVRLRLGAAGKSPLLQVNPKWEGLGELAAQTGHGGGDFWTLYYFAREILTGEKGPFDIYGGCDVTIPGIQALRSTLEGGKPMEVPDFRKQADRDRYRSDDWQQDRYDVKRGVFGGFVPDARDQAARFSTVMKDLVTCAPVYRAYAAWKTVQPDLTRPEEFLSVANQLLGDYPILVETYRQAREIVTSYPDSDGAQVLAEMLEVGGEQQVLAPGFLPTLKKEVAALRRRLTGRTKPGLEKLTRSALLADKTRIAAVPYPAKKMAFTALRHDTSSDFEDIRPAYQGTPKDGLVYCRGFLTANKAGAVILHIGADGPFKVFVNRKAILCSQKATHPIAAAVQPVPVILRKGRNEVVLAMRTDDGKAWGFMAHCVK